MSRSPFRYVVACMGGLLIAVAFACSAAEQKAAAAASTAPVCGIDINVSATLTLKAVPNVAICTPGSSVTWSLVWPASKPTGHSIEIEFATTNGLKGPFPKGAGAKDNPAPGRYSDKVTGGTKISTLPSRQPTDTFWKYTVTLRDASDNDVTTLDPIVIFK